MATAQGFQRVVPKRYSLPFFQTSGGHDGDCTLGQTTPENFENAP